MPMKPKRPCSFPGCPNLTDRRFCPEHEKLEAQRYERYDRDPATKRRYGRAWKRIRDSYAAEHPLCEVCLAKGVYTPTEEIHHKLPLSQGGTHDRSNLVALCKECHARIHAERGDRWHNRENRPGRSKSLRPFPCGTGVGLRAQKRDFKRGIYPGNWR